MAERRHSPIALRLALVLLSVAVLAVALVAVLAFLIGHNGYWTLEHERREALIDSVVAVATASYNTGHPGWSDTDLRPALALAEATDTRVTVRDLDSRVVASNVSGTEDPTQEVTRAITLNGTRIGTVDVWFSTPGLASSIVDLRSSLMAARVAAAGIAAVVALVVAVVVAQRLTRPVTQLIESANAMARGDRTARVGVIEHAPAELASLSRAFDDMADSVAREEQLRRNQADDIAHELHRPLAVLQAMSEAMLDDVVPRDKEHLVSLHEEILLLAGLVEDLQTLAAVRAAALHLQLQRCDLGSIAARVAEVWEASFAAAGLQLTRDLSAATVEVDPGRTHQVIANILSNAMKFTKSGGRVHMSVVSDTVHARLAIRDTGPGIDADEQAHLFERYWRSSGTDGTTGSGIGLTVAAEFMNAQHGRIEVDSEPGRGSCFTLVFPVAAVR
jgi:signal transduction histidine kinase